MTRQNTVATHLNEPWAHPWPAEDLEAVVNCPICGALARSLLYPDLVDNTFRAAPGKWALWTCANCRSAYLDPRPSQRSIHRAYENYYTHQVGNGKEQYADLSWTRKLRRRLVNGYTNWRFGTQARPSSSIGILAAYILPSIKKVLDREYRHLPCRPQAGGHLLDVGCGDGSFLSLALSCGWDAEGLDPDPMAVANSIKKGLNVHEGGIEYFDGQTELFDVITLNHVIEHVYEPLDVLKRCYALLKSGGSLWLETPNIDSFGHERFQNDWRGLEAPRHLALFNHESLENAIKSAGFTAHLDRGRLSACLSMFQSSYAISNGDLPHTNVAAPKWVKLQALKAMAFEHIFPSRREFLTIVAFKAPTA